MKKSIKIVTSFLGLLAIVLSIVIGVYLYRENSAPDDSQAAANSQWGRIANKPQNKQKVKAALLFAGSPNNNKSAYTVHPQSASWEWKSEADINKIFDEMKGANVNVIKLSWWGNEKEKTWSPTKYNTDTHKKVFQEANERQIMVAPMIEVHNNFKFWQEYPNKTSNLKNRIKQVLKDYGNQPNYLTLYDKQGNPRKVIWLIETIHVGKVDEQKFAQTFDTLANEIYKETGYRIGFVIDPTPLPANGTYNGPNPKYLKQTKSILAVNPFNITSDGKTEKQRLAKAEEILKKWNRSGIPLIAPILPRYNDSIVRNSGANIAKYGGTTSWRNSVKTLALKYQTDGVSLDCWNGFTEGYAFTPTKEDKNSNYELARTVLKQI